MNEKPQPIVNLVEQALDTDTAQPRADILLCGLQHIDNEDEVYEFVNRIYDAVHAFGYRRVHAIRAAQEARGERK